QQMIQAQQDQALAARISRIEIFLEDAQSFELLVQHPKLYENMLGQEDNLLLLQHQNNRLIEINPLQIHIPALHYTSALQFQNNHAEQPTRRLTFNQEQFKVRSDQLGYGKQLAEGQRILASYLSKLVLCSLLGILLSTWMACLAGLYIRKSMHQLMLA